MTDEANQKDENVAEATRNILPPMRVRGIPFAPGNPGKPRGARNKVTRLVEHLVEDEAEETIRAIVAHARAGNGPAIAAVARVLLPERKGRAVKIEVERQLDGTAASLAAVSTGVLRAASAGEISADEGMQWAHLIAAASRAYDLQGMEERLLQVEDELASLRRRTQ